jgi:hypothetical protein
LTYKAKLKYFRIFILRFTFIISLVNSNNLFNILNFIQVCAFIYGLDCLFLNIFTAYYRNILVHLFNSVITIYLLLILFYKLIWNIKTFRNIFFLVIILRIINLGIGKISHRLSNRHLLLLLARFLSIFSWLNSWIYLWRIWCTLIKHYRFSIFLSVFFPLQANFFIINYKYHSMFSTFWCIIQTNLSCITISFLYF